MIGNVPAECRDRGPDPVSSPGTAHTAIQAGVLAPEMGDRRRVGTVSAGARDDVRDSDGQGIAGNEVGVPGVPGRESGEIGEAGAGGADWSVEAEGVLAGRDYLPGSRGTTPGSVPVLAVDVLHPGVLLVP